MYLKFLKFSAFGVLTAVFYFLSYVIFLDFFSPVLSTIIAFTISVIVSYILNSKYVFPDKKGSFMTFFIIACSGLALNTVIVYFLTELLSYNSLLAGVIVLIVIPIHNFIFNYRFNFRDEFHDHQSRK